MNIQILVVEDNEHICNMVKAYLNDAGYHVDACSDGERALEMFYEKPYHLAVLDILLPGIDGHELLKEFRKLKDTPILMMTALSDDNNQIKAFSNEADDYIIKPFNIQILRMRVDSLLRRSGVLSKEIRHGKLVLFPESYKVEHEGISIALTRKEFEILLLLMQNKSKTFSSEQILSKIWGYDFECDESTVWTHIKNLRAKLPENTIKTVRGMGYCLEDIR
ncbi:MAG: response regulator transcription factor [Defluviitaleaceae bacterium]|nr:response regulator transcription factor [Defluviitaleaceae bacterium]